MLGHLLVAVLINKLIVLSWCSIPVIYICFGDIPNYLLVNIELASRNNKVVIISDSSPSRLTGNVKPEHHAGTMDSEGVELIPLKNHFVNAKRFAMHYKPLPNSSYIMNGSDHELQCFQRWFVLKDYMLATNIGIAYFSDGDSSVFVNVSSIHNKRSDCDGVINIDRQPHNFNWVAAGESSIWTTASISDFCQFVESIYSNKSYVATLELKYNSGKVLPPDFNSGGAPFRGYGGSAIVDMSLLWLWWVSHHRKDEIGWATGRPFWGLAKSKDALLKSMQPSVIMKGIKSIRDKSDAAFLFSANLALPSVNSSLKICNGMDVIDRTAFDHMHGWDNGFSFAFNLSGDGVPYFLGAALRLGGKPESLNDDEISRLEQIPIRLINIHYQGTHKHSLVRDVCKVLLQTAGRVINNAAVRSICEETKAVSIGDNTNKTFHSESSAVATIGTRRDKGSHKASQPIRKTAIGNRNHQQSLT